MTGEPIVVKLISMQIERSEFLSQLNWLTHGFFSPGSENHPCGESPHPDNFSFVCGPKEQVLDARMRACSELGIDTRELIFVNQQHGSVICCATQNQRGAGATPDRERLGPADALYTDESRVPLAILVADCLPLFLVDRRRRRVGLVHSGWRGTYEGIAHRFLDRWIQEGSQIGDLVAWLGPCIAACCFEVGSEVLECFQTRYPHWAHFLQFNPDIHEGPGAGYIDLRGMVQEQLRQAGLTSRQIDVSDTCTMCGRGYFSYRRDGSGKGHNMAVMALR